MNSKKTGLMAAGILVCVLAGAGIEHARQMLTTVPQEEPDPAETGLRASSDVSAPRTVVVKDDAALRAAAALRQRVAELEKALAQRDAERVPEPPKPQEAPADPPRRPSFSDRMEQLKKDNPEQYAEMQKRREEFRQSMEQRAQDRAEFLAAVDTKNMNDAQKENHAKLLETVARVNELMAQMNQPGVEHTKELHQQMGEAMGSLGELYTEERRYLLEETGRAVGYQGGQASDFADQMQAIIDNTTMPNFGRHGGGRGGQPIPVPGAGSVPAPAK
jgi:hypothetical protein